MSIGQTDMTWIQVLEQIEGYTKPDVYVEEWRLGWQAKEKLREALRTERQSMVTPGMGS